MISTSSQYSGEYRHAKNKDVEIKINLSHSSCIVEYILLIDGPDAKWQSTPYQSYKFSNEYDALEAIDDWLEGQN